MGGWSLVLGYTPGPSDPAPDPFRHVSGTRVALSSISKNSARHLVACAIVLSLAFVGASRADADPLPTWEEIGLPSARQVVMDPIRNRLLMFTYTSFRVLVQEMSLGDTTWREIVPTGDYLPRADSETQFAMFDSLGDRVLLLQGGVRRVAGTYELTFANGPRWRALGGGVGRSGVALAYDSKRRRILTFGGYYASGGGGIVSYSNELRWKSIDSLGSTALINAENPPRPTYRASMIYDSKRDRVVIYGGMHSSEIWECDLSATPAWRRLEDGPPRAGHRAIYDPIGDRMLAFGGESTAGFWSLAFGAAPPPVPEIPGDAVQAINAVFDPRSRRLIAQGGYRVIGPSQYLPINRVWGISLEDPTHWTDLAPHAMPPATPSDEWAVAHDVGRDLTWVIAWPSDTKCELWAFHPGGKWTHEPVEGAVKRTKSSLTLDRKRDRLLMYGGRSASGAQAEVLELRLSEPGPRSWRRVEPAGPIPEGRFAHGAVFDSLGDRLIVHQGNDGAPITSTWELSLGGMAPRWTQLPTCPDQRGGEIAYDTHRDRLLAGGYELWTLPRDGAWQLFSTSSAASRHYDPRRDELVKFSGDDFFRRSMSGLLPRIDDRTQRWPSLGGHIVYDARRDRYILVGQRSFELRLICPPVRVAPPAVLPDAVLGQPFAIPLDLGPGRLSRFLVPDGGRLPPWFRYSSDTGLLSGIPTATGGFPFAVGLTDSANCERFRTFDFQVRPCLRAVPPDTCLRPGSTTRVAFEIERYDTARVTRWSVRLRIPPQAALARHCETGDCPAAQLGDYFVWSGGYGTLSVRVDADSTIELRGTTPPNACGTGRLRGVLFTADLVPTDVTGTGTVQLIESTIETCTGSRVWRMASCAEARVSHDGTGPRPIADLSASPEAEDGVDGVTAIGLTFTPPEDASRVEVYRVAHGGYPTYEGGVAPAAPTYPPGPPWRLAGVGVSSLTDLVSSRDYFYYVAFVMGACGGVSSASNIAAAPSYLLGDVWPGPDGCSGDGVVNLEDLARMLQQYGARFPDPGPNDPVCLDIGPTNTGTPGGRPVPDGVIDFEDLVIFASSYPSASPSRPSGRPPSHRARLEVPGVPAVGSEYTIALRLEGIEALRAVQFQLDYDDAVVRLEGVAGDELLAHQTGLPFLYCGAADRIDLALCGAPLSGSGTLLRMTFRVLKLADPRIRIAAIDARDIANRRVLIEREEPGTPVIRETTLSPVFPNPSHGAMSLRLQLAEAGSVSADVYDLQGRLVRTLIRGWQDAGDREISWDGRDDSGALLQAGLYILRLDASGTRYSRRIAFVP